MERECFNREIVKPNVNKRSGKIWTANYPLDLIRRTSDLRKNEESKSDCDGLRSVR